MTVIVAKKYSNEIIIASDSQTSAGETFMFTSKKKIKKMGDMVVGSSGYIKDIDKFNRFLKSKTFKQFRGEDDVCDLFYDFLSEYNVDSLGIIIIRHGQIYEINVYSDQTFLVKKDNEATIGSGGEYAMICLSLTDDVVKVVKTVCAFHQGCSGKIQKETILLNNKKTTWTKLPLGKNWL